MKIVILIVIIIVASILYILFERFVNTDINNPNEPYIFRYQPKYLFPTQDLDNSCKDLGFKIASMPMTCVRKDGKYDMKSNCKCIDDDNYCTVCYNPIDINSHNYNILTSIKYRDSELINSA